MVLSSLHWSVGIEWETLPSSMRAIWERRRSKNKAPSSRLRFREILVIRSLEKGNFLSSGKTERYRARELRSASMVWFRLGCFLDWGFFVCSCEFGGLTQQPAAEDASPRVPK